MDIWSKLSKVDIQNKELYQNIFNDTVKSIQAGTFKFSPAKREETDYYTIIESNRMNSYFVHIVPKVVYPLFQEMQEKAPNQFLGFSVTAGTHNGKDVRVSCFGVQCNLLGKALFKKTTIKGD